MLIEKVIDHYIEVGKKHPGNPFRLSNSGRCARALAYQRFQSLFKSRTDARTGLDGSGRRETGG
jgi:hypothetical protein